MEGEGLSPGLSSKGFTSFLDTVYKNDAKSPSNVIATTIWISHVLMDSIRSHTGNASGMPAGGRKDLNQYFQRDILKDNFIEVPFQGKTVRFF